MSVTCDGSGDDAEVIVTPEDGDEEFVITVKAIPKEEREER